MRFVIMNLSVMLIFDISVVNVVSEVVVLLGSNFFFIKINFFVVVMFEIVLVIDIRGE